jgi:hypothetical protein
LALLGVVVFVAVADVVFGALMDRIYADSAANPVAQIARSGATTLIAGSSTAKYAIDPAALTAPAYNAGQNGQSGYYVAALLTALPSAGRLGRLIYALDPADLVEGAGGSPFENLRAFAPWAGTDTRLRRWLSHGSSLAGLPFRSGFHRYRTLAPGIVFRWLWPSWSRDGYVALHGSLESLPPRPPDTGGARPVGATGAALLQAIAAETARLGLELVVVVTPTLGEDRAAAARFSSVLAAMRRTFAPLPFCDLTVVGDARLDRMMATPSLFHDGPHPNREGARRYATILDDLIGERCGPEHGRRTPVPFRSDGAGAG